MTNGNESATGYAWSSGQHGTGGLTKREYFAAMAMQGLLASNIEGMSMCMIDIHGFASQSVVAADALINALNANK